MAMYIKAIVTLIITVFILSVFLFLQISQVSKYSKYIETNQYLVWKTLIDLDKKRSCEVMFDCDTAYLRYIVGHKYLDNDNDWIPCESLCLNN